MTSELATLPLEQIAAAQVGRIYELGKIPERFVLFHGGEVVLDRERDVTGGGTPLLIADVLGELGQSPFDQFLTVSSGKLTKTPAEGEPQVLWTVMARREGGSPPAVEVAFVSYSDPALGRPWILSVDKFGAEALSPELDPLRERMEGRPE